MEICNGLRVGKVADMDVEQPSRPGSLLVAIARSAEELTSGKGWPDGVIDLMADLGRITGVSRVWIFQTLEVTPDYIVQDYPFEWASKPEYVQLTLPRFNMFRTEIDNQEYRALITSRQQGEWQSVTASRLAPSWLKDDQDKQAILSMLTIPIMVEGRWWGTLGFDDCEREYLWSHEEIALLRTAAFLIANAILRDRLSAKTKQFEILQGVTQSSSWELDLRKGHFWCSTTILLPVPGITDNMHLSVRDMLRLVHPADRKQLLARFRTDAASGETTFRHDLRMANQTGSYVWVEAIGNMFRNEEGKIEKMAGIAVEILKRKQKEEELRSIAKTDPLTGIANRGVFDNRFAAMMEQYLDHGQGFSLVLADIDNFKRINDTWGHSTGDKVLKHLVSLCQNNLRSSDLFARIGGEEFAILIEDSSPKAALGISERIRKDVAASPLSIDAETISFTVSLGYGGLPGPYDVRSVSSFYKLVDRALYMAKNRGRNRVVAVDDLEADDIAGSRGEP